MSWCGACMADCYDCEVMWVAKPLGLFTFQDAAGRSHRTHHFPAPVPRALAVTALTTIRVIRRIFTSTYEIPQYHIRAALQLCVRPLPSHLSN